MKKKLYEAQKNYLVCGILMLMVGIVMLFMPKTVSIAWGCIGVGTLFVFGFLLLLKRDGLMEVEDEKKKEKEAKTEMEQSFEQEETEQEGIK